MDRAAAGERAARRERGVCSCSEGLLPPGLGAAGAVTLKATPWGSSSEDIKVATVNPESTDCARLADLGGCSGEVVLYLFVKRRDVFSLRGKSAVEFVFSTSRLQYQSQQLCKKLDVGQSHGQLRVLDYYSGYQRTCHGA